MGFPQSHIKTDAKLYYDCRKFGQDLFYKLSLSPWPTPDLPAKFGANRT